MKHCTICSSDLKSLKASPQHGKRKHAEHERVCEECWEAWISLNVEESKPDEIECMFCTSTLDFEQIAKLALEGTMVRYAENLKDDTIGVYCMKRCTKKKHAFDREKDGRIFTCEDCGHEKCVDCDRPEHKNLTCSVDRKRLCAIHADAEHASHEALKAFGSCPGCDMHFTTEKCGFTQCTYGYRFCSGCMIPWVGEGSAYLGGKAAHGEGCLYLTRDKPSKHGLKRRFQESDEVQARIDQRDLDNKNKREAKKAKVATETKPKAKGKKGGKSEAKTEAEATQENGVKLEGDFKRESRPEKKCG